NFEVAPGAERGLRALEETATASQREPAVVHVVSGGQRVPGLRRVELRRGTRLGIAERKLRAEGRRDLARGRGSQSGQWLALARCAQAPARRPGSVKVPVC